MIIVRTPLRISYFGGGTDLPSWYKNNKKGGAVIASAINKYSYINIRYLEKFYDHNFRIRYYRNEEKSITALSIYWLFLFIVWFVFFVIMFIYNDAVLAWCKELIS